MIDPFNPHDPFDPFELYNSMVSPNGQGPFLEEPLRDVIGGEMVDFACPQAQDPAALLQYGRFSTAHLRYVFTAP